MELVGVFGNPVSHSLSPIMHNSAFNKMKKNAKYLPLLVQPNELKNALIGAKALGFTGLNITIPFKETIIPCLGELTNDAVTVGSVNTVLFRDGMSYGHTTDGPGFVTALKEELSVNTTGANCLVIGAGGASRPIVYELVKKGANVYLTNRTQERAESLVATLGLQDKCQVITYADSSLNDTIKFADIIINTTSVGMSKTKDSTPIPTSMLNANHIVVDIIYNPGETLLLKEARLKGCRIQNGVGMLVWQAVKSWEFWWGIKPPVDVMYNAVLKSLDNS